MVLTPSDFLSLHSQHNIPDIVDDSNSDYDAEKKPTTSSTVVIGNLEMGSKCLSQFWTLWNNERVPRKPDCHLIARPQVGEVVLIKDKLPCGHWKVGKIFRIDCG